MRFCLALMMVFVTAAFAEEPPATAPAVISASDKDAIDAAMQKEVVIEGVIDQAAWSRSGKVMNIEFKDAQESRLLAVIFEKNRPEMDSAFAGDVGKALMGAKVRIKGMLRPYGGKAESMKGRPQIILTNTNQITIVEPAPTTAPATEPAESK